MALLPILQVIREVESRPLSQVPPKMFALTESSRCYSVETALTENSVVGNAVTVGRCSPRQHASIVSSLAGDIYRVGGFSGSALRSVDMFSFESGRWTDCKALHQPRGRPALCTFTYGTIEYLLVAGGFSGRMSPALAKCEFTSLAGSLCWRNIPPMPEARHGACMVSTGCSIFVLGGRAGPGDHGRPLTTMFRLEKADLFSDFQTGVWKQCASMKHSRSSFGCLAFKGVVFAVGGLTGIKVVDSVELYDPSQNSWTAGPRLNHARAHLNISVYQDRFIQAIGGQDADGKSVTTAEIWDLEMVEPCWKVVDFPLCFSGDKPCFVSVGVWWPMDGEFSYDIERSEEQLSPREIWNIEARKTIEYNPYREQEMKGTLPMLSFDRGMSPSSSPRNATIKSPQSLRRSNDESFRLTQGANEENVTPADEVEFAESCFSPLPYKPVDISSGFRTPEEVRQHKMFDFMTPISAVRIPEMPGDISPDPLTTSLPSDPSILLAANKAFMLAQAPFVDHESASVASCQSSETPILYPDSTPRGMHGGTFSFERGNFVGAEQRLFASSDSSSDGLSPVMLTDGQSSTDNMFPSRSSLSGYALTLDDRTKLLLRDMLDGIDDPSPEVVHALQCLNATSKSSSSRGPALFAYAKPCCGKLCVFSDKKALRKSWDLDQVVRAKPMKADPMQWLSEG